MHAFAWGVPTPADAAIVKRHPQAGGHVPLVKCRSQKRRELPLRVRTLNPGVVEQLSYAACSWHNVLTIVEAAFFAPAGAGHGLEDVRGAEAAIQA
jgi:hypothetical protein